MEMTFRPAPPSMRVFVPATLLMVGVHVMGSASAAAADLGWSWESKAMIHSGRVRGRKASGWGRAAFAPTKELLGLAIGRRLLGPTEFARDLVGPLEREVRSELIA